MKNDLPRKPYATPTLRVHGSIAQLTRQIRPRSGLDSDFETLESSNAKVDTNL
jgi:hypothetical protein